jgi:hypothetical protein
MLPVVEWEIRMKKTYEKPVFSKRGKLGALAAGSQTLIK